MSEKILVTGGAGYLGSVLVPHLLENGYAVRVLDLFRNKQIPLTHCLDYEGFEPVKGDCRDQSTLRECLKDVDWIIPLAAIVGAPACEINKTGASSINFDSIVTLNLLRGSIPVIFPNTNSGYGSTKEVCTEETPLNPISHYGRTKTYSEKFLLDRKNVTVFRLATVFGPSPRMRLDLLVNDFTYRAVTDKTLVLYEEGFLRNYMHVHDVARLFLFAIRNYDKMKDQVFNAGLHYCLTKRELCKEIQKWVPDFQFLAAETGSDPDKRNYNVSVEKLEQAGFRCATSLSRGIRELIRLYKMLPNKEFTNA